MSRSCAKFVVLTVMAVGLVVPTAAEAQFPGAPACRGDNVHVRPDSSRALNLCGFNAPVEITRAPEHGQLSPQVRGAGTMRYTPHPGYKGPDSFAFRAAGAPASVPDAEMTITVTEANGAPTCRLDDVTISTEGQASFANACTDPDEGDSVRVHVAQAPEYGRLFTFGTTAFYSPAEDRLGAHTFALRADDGTRTSAAESVTVTVVAQQPPACPDRTQVVRKNATISIDYHCAFADGNVHFPIDFDFVDGLAHGSVLRDMFNARYAPDDGFTGSDEVTLRVPWTRYHLGGPLTDPFKVTFQVTEAGNAPTCDRFGGRLQVRSGRSIDLLSYCSDRDGDDVALSVPEKPYRGAVSTHGWGQFIYTADAGYSGPDRLSIRASDGISESAALQHRIHVLADTENTAPFCGNGSAQELNMGASAVFSAGCGDAEGDPLEYVIDQPKHGTVEFMALMGSPSLVYKRTEDFTGEDTFTYRAKDDRGSESALMTARVIAPPPPPPSGSLAPSCHPGGTLAVRPGVERKLWVSCSEPNNFAAIPATVLDPPDHGTVTQDWWSQESFTYLPDAGYDGPDRITFRATNSAGHADVTYVFDVDAANNVAPTCWRQRELTVRTSGTVTASCTDNDGDTPAFAIDKAPEHGTISGDVAAGSFTYTADDGYAGVDRFTYSVSDGHGGTALVTQVVRVRGEVANVTPDCGRGGGYGVNPGGSVSIYWACSDADGDAFTLDVATPPAHGTITPGGPGGFTYTAAPGFIGTDSVTLVADDGRGKSEPGVVTFMVRDFSQPQPAICRSLAANVAPDRSRELTLSCPFAFTAPTIVIADPPQHGKLSEVGPNGLVTYTPDPGYVGPDAFVFQGRTGDVDGQPATVSLHVGEPPPLPSDVTADRAIGPDPPGTPPSEEDDEEEPNQQEPTQQPPAPAGGGQAPPAVAAPVVIAPSLRDVVLQAMKGAIRAVLADLGDAQAFVPAQAPKPGSRLTKMLGIACPDGCGVRVKAKLVAGRHSAPLPARKLTLGRAEAGTVAYKVRAADRRRLRRPKRAFLVMQVKLRDAAGVVRRDEITVGLILR